jgi:hypothetical protein
MDRAIHFDDQACPDAVEVDDESIDRMLPSEFEAAGPLT